MVPVSRPGPEAATAATAAVATLAALAGIVLTPTPLEEPAAEAPKAEATKPAEPRTRETALAFAPSDEGPPGSCQLAVGLGADRPPLPDPTLRFLLARVDSQRVLEVTEATPDMGGYRFTGLRAGTYHLSIFAEGAEAAAPAAFSCAGDGERVYVEVNLRPAAAFARGRVLGKDSQPVPGAALLVERAGGTAGTFEGVLHVDVSEDGGFTVPLPPGRYRFLGLAPSHGATQQDVTIASSGRAELVIALPWRPMARGRIVNAAGQPVPGAHVFAGPRYDPNAPANVVVTDAAGRFSLPLPPDQRVQLTARGEDGLASVRMEPVHGLEGPAGIELVLGQGRTLEGYVQRRDGRPHAFGEVRYRVRALGMSGTASTDKEGAFRLPAMPVAHDVELWAEGSAVGAWGAQVATPGRHRVLLTYAPPAY